MPISHSSQMKQAISKWLLWVSENVRVIHDESTYGECPSYIICGLNATELFKICEKNISPRSQTIKPTIKLYKRFSVNSELNPISWSKHRRGEQQYLFTNVNPTNNDLCWCQHGVMSKWDWRETWKKCIKYLRETICMWLIQNWTQWFHHLNRFLFSFLIKNILKPYFDGIFPLEI